MNFLKKLFGYKAEEQNRQNPSTVEPKKNPDNTRLLFLLNNYSKHASEDNYMLVYNELVEGNSYLLLPSVNDGDNNGGWKTMETGGTLKLTSVFDLDGLKVLGAFTDEQALVTWTKSVTQYTSMRSLDIIEFCQQNNISRIVINSDQPTMFVLERNQNFSTLVTERDTQVAVGFPARPLAPQLIEKFKEQFGKVNNILEAYQYLMQKEGEQSLVLGIKLSTVSENARLAVHNAINNAMEGEHLDLPLDIYIIQSESWYETIRGITNSLFYKRSDLALPDLQSGSHGNGSLIR